MIKSQNTAIEEQVVISPAQEVALLLVTSNTITRKGLIFYGI